MRVAARRLITVLCLVQFIDVMGVTVVLTALPVILRDLDLPDSASTLLSTSYAVLFGGCLMLGARVGDVYGHRRTVMASLIAYCAASVLAQLSVGLVSLTLARALQGVAAAASVPAALRLLTTLTPDGEPRRRAVAGWSAAGATAGACGFILGGFATQLASWRLAFAVIAAMSGVLALMVQVSVPPDARSPRPSKLDVGGGLLLTAAVMCFVAGTTAATGVDPGVGVGLLVVSGVLVLVLIRVERRRPHAILSGQVVSLPPVRWGAAGSFVNTATTSSSATLVTLHLQDVLRLSPLAAGAFLVPLSLAAVLGSAFAGRALRHRSMTHALAVGLSVIAAGNLVLFSHQEAPAVLTAVTVMGFGLGLASVAANSLGTHVPEGHKATSAGILNTSAQLGTATGIAVILLVASSFSFSLAWAAAAAGAAVLAVALARARPFPTSAS